MQRRQTKRRSPCRIFPARCCTGSVAFVYPYLDDATRTGRVRVELDNPGRAEAGHVRQRRRCSAISASAWPSRSRRSSTPVPRRFVFLDLGEGRLEPRASRSDARPAIWSRSSPVCSEGDVIVTSGNFLIAAESRLDALAAMGASWPTAVGLVAGSSPPARGTRFSRCSSSPPWRRGAGSLRQCAARRHPRPVRRAGHRLHRVAGAEPRPRRGPDHLSDLVDACWRRRASSTCAASRCSACRSSTSSSRTAPTSTGRAAACSST